MRRTDFFPNDILSLILIKGRKIIKKKMRGHSGRQKRAYVSFYILQEIRKGLKMDARTAIVFGSTGLVGRSLVDELCASDTYSVIKLFVRKSGAVYGLSLIHI